jgi:hypothetical protein
MSLGTLVPAAVSADSVPSDTCTSVPPRVPNKNVPADVKEWALGAPVIGSGPIWLFRKSVIWDRAKHPWPPLEDGTYSIGKVPWFLRDKYEAMPTITGKRVDGPGTFTASVNGARSGGHDWFVSGLRFSAAGCWKVVGTWDHTKVAFRILVG